MLVTYMGEQRWARAAAKSERSDGSRMVHVRLDPGLHRRLRIMVAVEDTSIQDWLAHLIEKSVAEQWQNAAKERE